MSDIFAQISQNYLRIMERVNYVANSVERDPQEIRLLVVTKGQPVEKVQAVIAAGARLLGESYVEEATPKIQYFQAETNLEWHMIGHVQSRKARPVCEQFNKVHSVDSLKLAKRLDQFSGELRRRLPILLEFNMSGEASKFGMPAWEEDHWRYLLDDVTSIAEFPNLALQGLMTVPPFDADPETSRPFYRSLCRLRDYLRTKIPGANLFELSMGMSQDYEIAIQEGATILRVGEAILGRRT